MQHITYILKTTLPQRIAKWAAKLGDYHFSSFCGICGDCMIFLHEASFQFVLHIVAGHLTRSNYSAVGYYSSSLKYSRFRVSSPVCTLHIAITHVIEVLKLQSLMWVPWQLACETQQFKYSNHVCDCSVQGTNRTRNPTTTVFFHQVIVLFAS